ITHAAPRTVSPFAGRDRTLIARESAIGKGRSAMTASNGQAGNRGSGNGSAATGRDAAADPANPQQFQPTSEPANGRISAENVSLMEFSFNGQRVRPVLLDGETWFVAADVCAVLEHSNSRVALSRLDDDEKGVTSVYTPGGVQEMNIINESGLYALIFSSRKPGGPGVPPMGHRRGAASDLPDRSLRDGSAASLPGTLRPGGDHAHAARAWPLHRGDASGSAAPRPSDGLRRAPPGRHRHRLPNPGSPTQADRIVLAQNSGEQVCWA